MAPCVMKEDIESREFERGFVTLCAQIEVDEAPHGTCATNADSGLHVCDQQCHVSRFLFLLSHSHPPSLPPSLPPSVLFHLPLLLSSLPLSLPGLPLPQLERTMLDHEKIRTREAVENLSSPSPSPSLSSSGPCWTTSSPSRPRWPPPTRCPPPSPCHLLRMGGGHPKQMASTHEVCV